MFKQQNPLMKIGFSKFCTPRSKWCVSAGFSGTHAAVCVSVIHQNVILLLHGAQIEDYKQLLEMALNDMAKSNCMFHCCLNCTGYEPIRDLLSKKI